ncbi:MAG TPA: FAD-binding protein [Dehalococcoidales bacterium]|nr:FAD-binding protein [Dehalococcoidales bacterium]
MHYEDFIKDAPRWPYPVNYGKENEVDCDVLVLGGGIAGCWAAIGAAREGAKVVLVEKGATKSSGAGGSGVDHWHCVTTNPASTVSPEEFAQALVDSRGGWRNAITAYITSRDSYDCLLDMEKFGMRIRDSDDEFKGAAFRDEATKLLFAYDYTAKYCARVWGHNVKEAIYKEARRLGVQIYDHVFISSLLTAGGKQGARVVGATGINARTGEFYIFKGKASVLGMYFPQRQWIFSTEIRGLTYSHRTPNLTGDGHAMLWQAGAVMAGVEASSPGGAGPYGFPQYGYGNAQNTWYACTMVDSSGKEIPWVDRDGNVLKTVAERYRPAPGQRFFISGGGEGPDHRYRGPNMLPVKGQPGPPGAPSDKAIDAEMPLYADLPSMPPEERRVIFGLMIGQEGKTLIPIYRTYTQAGFDPDKDLLQSYSLQGAPQWRQMGGGGVISGGGPVVDWNLMTSLEGLFAAGGQIFFNGDHAYAASTGRWAGKHAAQYAAGATQPTADRQQVAAEKTRVYAPAKRTRGIEWKELNAGVCKVMQDYCGAIKSETLLKLGLKWFEEIREGEATQAFARNPHELVRILEVFNIITNGEMIMEGGRARKASNSALGFTRSDYPQVNPPDWQKWVTIKQDQGKIKTGELALDYHGDLKQNYAAHSGRK